MTKVCKIYDVLIIGAGAAGLFLAANLRGKSVALLEKNTTPGKKILASGGGRCNVTNRRIAASNYLGDADFAANILKNLSFQDVLKFFGELKFNEQKQNQFFCESGSHTVLSVLLKKVEQSGAKIFCGMSVASVRKILVGENSEILDDSFAQDIKFDDSGGKNGTPISENFDTKKPQSGKRNLSEIFEVVTENGDKFYAENLVVASGGLSYKSLGASDIGYKIARDFGVAVAPPAPALVGFTAQKDEFWFKNLSGVCFPARIIVGYAQSGRQGSGDESDLPCKGVVKACENASGASRNENNFSAPYKDLSVSSGDQALLQTGNASPPEKAVPLTFSKSDKKIEFNKPNADFVISQEIKFDGGGKSSSRKNTVNLRQKTQRKFVGDILFTHKGISGPAVLNASLFWQKGLIAINFCPNFNIETARKSKKQLSTILPLPRRFTLEFLRAAGLGDKPYGEYKADELEKISRLFCYKFAPAGTFGFERAEVTKGGVDTDALDANCEHNGTRGLYFIGEVLNVTGMLGGYNLHFAFACAANLAKRLNARRACLADY